MNGLNNRTTYQTLLESSNQNEFKQNASSSSISRSNAVSWMRLVEKSQQPQRRKELRILETAFKAKYLWREYTILDRLRYKNTNQHRSAPYLKKLLQVRRFFARLKELRLDSLIDIPQSDNVNDKKLSPMEIKQMISQAESLMYRLICIHALLGKMVTVVERCYISFRGAVSQTHFMAQFITIMGSLARCHFLIKALRQDVSQFYNILYATRIHVLDDDEDVDDQFMNKFPSDILKTNHLILRRNSNDMNSQEPEKICVDEDPVPEVTPSIGDLGSFGIDASNMSISDQFWTQCLSE